MRKLVHVYFFQKLEVNAVEASGEVLDRQACHIPGVKIAQAGKNPPPEFPADGSATPDIAGADNHGKILRVAKHLWQTFRVMRKIPVHHHYFFKTAGGDGSFESVYVRFSQSVLFLS